MPAALAALARASTELACAISVASAWRSARVRAGKMAVTRSKAQSARAWSAIDSPHDFNCGFMRDEPGLISKVQQLLGGTGDDFAAIESVVIDVHSDELLGERQIEVPSE